MMGQRGDPGRTPPTLDSSGLILMLNDLREVNEKPDWMYSVTHISSVAYSIDPAYTVRYNRVSQVFLSTGSIHFPSQSCARLLNAGSRPQ